MSYIWPSGMQIWTLASWATGDLKNLSSAILNIFPVTIVTWIYTKNILYCKYGFTKKTYRKTNTECAVEAGYDENSAYVSASKLQNPLLYPLVTQYIGRLRAEKIKKYDITYEKHLAELGKIRDEARENKAWSAAGNMEIARGKAGGFQNNTNLHLHKNLDNADESELDKMLEQALKNYKPIFDSKAEVVEAEAEDIKE